MPIDYRKNAKTTRMGYLEQWRQAIQTFSPRLYAAMSFVLPLVAVPIATTVAKKGYEYAKKKLREQVIYLGYFYKWRREFISESNKTLIISLVATGIIAPIIAYTTKEIIKKITRKR